MNSSHLFFSTRWCTVIIRFTCLHLFGWSISNALNGQKRNDRVTPKHRNLHICSAWRRCLYRNYILHPFFLSTSLLRLITLECSIHWLSCRWFVHKLVCPAIWEAVFQFFFSGQESRFWYILVLVTRLHLAYNPIPARLVKVSLLTAVTIRATSSMNPTRCITCSNMVRRPLRDFAINFSVYGSLFHLGDHFLLW